MLSLLPADGTRYWGSSGIIADRRQGLSSRAGGAASLSVLAIPGCPWRPPFSATVGFPDDWTGGDALRLGAGPACCFSRRASEGENGWLRAPSDRISSRRSLARPMSVTDPFRCLPNRQNRDQGLKTTACLACQNRIHEVIECAQDHWGVPRLSSRFYRRHAGVYRCSPGAVAYWPGRW